MASVSGHMQSFTDESCVEGDGNDSIRVSSSAPTDVADKKDLVMFWHKRLQWLEAEVDQHKLQLVILKKSQETSDEIEDPTKTRDLQQKLMRLSTDKKIIQSIFHSVELGQRLIEIMSSESDKDTDPKLKNEILETVERTTESVSNVLRIHKEIESQLSTLLNLKEECVVLQQESRKFMYELQQLLEREKMQKKVPSNNDEVARLQNENAALTAKITSTHHCFQGLIFGSGVNWAKDTKLQDIVLGIDHPLEDLP